MPEQLEDRLVRSGLPVAELPHFPESSEEPHEVRATFMHGTEAQIVHMGAAHHDSVAQVVTLDPAAVDHVMESMDDAHRESSEAHPHIEARVEGSTVVIAYDKMPEATAVLMKEGHTIELHEVKGHGDLHLELIEEGEYQVSFVNAQDHVFATMEIEVDEEGIHVGEVHFEEEHEHEHHEEHEEHDHEEHDEHEEHEPHAPHKPHHHEHVHHHEEHEAHHPHHHHGEHEHPDHEDGEEHPEEDHDEKVPAKEEGAQKEQPKESQDREASEMKAEESRTEGKTEESKGSAEPIAHLLTEQPVAGETAAPQKEERHAAEEGGSSDLTVPLLIGGTTTTAYLARRKIATAALKLFRI